MQSFWHIAVAFCLLTVISGCQVRVDGDAPSRSSVTADQPKFGALAEDQHDAELQFEEHLVGKMRQPVRPHWILDDETLDTFIARLRRDLGIPVIVDENQLDSAGIQKTDKVNSS